MSQRRTSLGVVFLVLFLDLVGFSILFPLYPAMLTHYLDNDPGALRSFVGWLSSQWPEADANQRAALFGGILGGGYALIQFITAPIWGRLSDRIGRRPILMLNLAGSLIAYLLWMVAANFTLLLLSRLAAGLMGGAAIMASAAVADVTESPKDRARGMGFVGMAFGLGFILGPVIGGVSYWMLPRLDGIGDLAAWGVNPFTMPALIAVVLSAINLVWASRSFVETLPLERRGQRSQERSMNPIRIFLGDPVFVRINFTTFLHTTFFAGLEATLGFLVMARLDYGPRHIAALFGGMGLVSALMQGGVFRRIAPRTGAKSPTLVGFALLVLGFALVGLIDQTPSTLLLACGVAVLAAGTGLVFPGLSTLTSLAADEANQGRAMGGWRSASSLGRAIGPLAAALLYFRLAPAAPYWVGAVGMILPFVVLSGLRPRR